MYSVTAPANTCDFPEGHDPDNAPQKNELKLVVPNDPSKDDEVPLSETEVHTVAADTGSDASTLAAKILQMHATADELKPTASRRPTLTGATDEAGFDMPGVLRTPVRGSRNIGLQPEQVPAPAAVSKAAANFRHGPSFRTLLISTLVIVGVGAGAVYLSLSDLLAGKEADSRTVQTQQINTEPTIESLIAGADPEYQGRTDLTATPTASAEQVKSAKDRIREVFASRSIASTAPEDHSNPLGHDTNKVADDKIQSRLAPAQPAPVRTNSQSARGTTNTLVASAAAAVQETDENPVPDVSPLEADIPAVTAPDTDTASASTPETSAAASDFPLSAKIKSSVNLREAQNKDATVLAVIPAGAEVRFNTCGNWWCGVQYDGKTGYVGESFLEPQQQP